MDLGQLNTYKTKQNHNTNTKKYSNKILFARLNSKSGDRTKGKQKKKNNKAVAYTTYDSFKLSLYQVSYK